MIGRRGFIQGVVSAIAATTVVIEATPTEIQAFSGKVGMPAFSGLLGQAESRVPIVEMGEFVYNHEGKIIGVIRNIDIHRPIMEVTTRWDSLQRHVPAGLLYAEYSVVSYGPVRVRAT